MLGKTVFSSTIKGNNPLELSKSNGFKSGIYLLKAIDNTGKTYAKKFIVK